MKTLRSPQPPLSQQGWRSPRSYHHSFFSPLLLGAALLSACAVPDPASGPAEAPRPAPRPGTGAPPPHALDLPFGPDVGLDEPILGAVAGWKRLPAVAAGDAQY